MTKSLIAIFSGFVLVSTGLIPIAKNIFSINIFNDAPIFFLLGGLWLLLIIVFIYSSNASKRQLSKNK